MANFPIEPIGRGKGQGAICVRRRGEVRFGEENLESAGRTSRLFEAPDPSTTGYGVIRMGSTRP